MWLRTSSHFDLVAHRRLDGAAEELARRRVKAAEDAPVQDDHFTLVGEEQVAGVHVAVEGPGAQHHGEPRVQQVLDRFFASKPNLSSDARSSTGFPWMNSMVRMRRPEACGERAAARSRPLPRRRRPCCGTTPSTAPRCADRAPRPSVRRGQPPCRAASIRCRRAAASPGTEQRLDHRHVLGDDAIGVARRIPGEFRHAPKRRIVQKLGS